MGKMQNGNDGGTYASENKKVGKGISEGGEVD